MTALLISHKLLEFPFTRDSSIRPGWLTVGPGLTNSNFDAETYRNYFKPTENRIHTHLTGMLSFFTTSIASLIVGIEF